MMMTLTTTSKAGRAGAGGEIIGTFRETKAFGHAQKEAAN